MSSLQVFVNGDSQDLPPGLSLGELLQQLELPLTRVAVELNRSVIRRANWDSTILQEDDRVEIVHFVGGGSQ